MTLIEVLTASLILAAVLFAFFRLFAIASRGVGEASQRAFVQGALAEVSALLQKYLASGDSRFFAFSGRGGVGDRAVLRVLAPMPGRCADMTLACPADTAFLYTHYDKSLSPAVSAICKYAPREFLVDANNPTYGPATFVAGTGFQITAPGPGPVTYPTGPIPVRRNRLLAIANPPNFSMWVATGPPVRLPVVQTAPGVYSPPFANPDCAANLRVDGAGNADLARLYRVPFQPLVLQQLTGGGAVTNAEIDSALGRFPMRLFAAQIRGLGRILLPAPNPPVFGLRGCQYAGGNLACNDFLPYDVPGVRRVRVFEGFRAALQPDDAVDFEIIGPGGAAGANCAPPICPVPPNCTTNCRVLASAGVTGIPVRFTAGESYSQPASAGFSFLKQDLIKQMKIRLDFAQKQDEFRVNFP